MKTITFLLISLFSFLSLSTCSDSEKTFTKEITVASEMRNCMGVGPMRCLLVKEDGSPQWEFWYTGIEGFEYVPGYEYKLKIKGTRISNPPQDASSIKYELVRLVSKSEKTSENMPAEREF